MRKDGMGWREVERKGLISTRDERDIDGVKCIKYDECWVIKTPDNKMIMGKWVNRKDPSCKLPRVLNYRSEYIGQADSLKRAVAMAKAAYVSREIKRNDKG